MNAKTLAKIYANAAAIMEREGYGSVSDAGTAISRATKRYGYNTKAGAGIAFRESFGCWINNDEGILMLCFASAIAGTGEVGQWFQERVDEMRAAWNA